MRGELYTQCLQILGGGIVSKSFGGSGHQFVVAFDASWTSDKWYHRRGSAWWGSESGLKYKESFY